MQRCNNPKIKCYPNYGGKGIAVEYTAEEFATWFVANWSGSLVWPSVGRIDHSKNYSLDNIEMIEHAANAREMYDRTGGNATVEQTPVVLVGDDAIHAFSNNKRAAEFAGVTPSYVCLRKRIKADPAKKTKFKYQVFDLDNFLGGRPS